MGFQIKLAVGGVLKQKQEELDKEKEAEAVRAAEAAASENSGTAGITGTAASESTDAAPPSEAAITSDAKAADPQPVGTDASGTAAETTQEHTEPQGSTEAAEEAEASGGRRFIWDAAKGELVEVGVVDRKARRKVGRDTRQAGGAATATDATAAGAQGENQEEGEQEDEEMDDEDVENEDEEEEDAADSEGSDVSGEEGMEVEQDSRAIFLEEASTPELIKQAVSLGGAMAQGVVDRWVCDEATKLYFRYETASKQMHCWNTEQGCLYQWHTSRRLRFVWASPNGPSPPPATLPSAAGGAPQAAQAANGVPAAAPVAVDAQAARQDGVPAGTSEAASAASSQRADQSTQEPYKGLWVTIIPPSVLAAGWADPSEQISEEMELNGRALAAVIGKGGNSIKEIQQSSGVKATSRKQQGEKAGVLTLEGTRSQIAAAKAAIEQRLVVALGQQAVEKMQKYKDNELLAQKRNETGAEAAKKGVSGLSAFVEQWGIQAVWARKLAKMDAMFQRHLIRRFKPLKAKPMSALRSFVAALQKYPQWWRLEALQEDGELDGEICETIIIGENGAVVGSAPAEAQEGAEQLIELEVDGSMGDREASRSYGDVQPQHCRLMRVGSNYYVCALDSQIGTVTDGQKIRELDGPVPIRDGTLLGVGKYLLYCEVEEPAKLQERRRRLLSGEGLQRPSKAEVPAKDSEGAQQTTGTEGAPAEAASGADLQDEDCERGEKRTHAEAGSTVEDETSAEKRQKMEETFSTNGEKSEEPKQVEASEASPSPLATDTAT